MSDPTEPRDDADRFDNFDDGDCGNCGGEGVTYDCIDGCCVNAEDGCALCERRCDWCNPAPKSKTADALRQILADALDGKLAATQTYMDGDQVVIREITPEEFYLPGPVNVTPSSDAERTKVSSQASGHHRVEPKQKINPSNGDEQP